MYEKAFRLLRNPFMLTADPHFLMLFPGHRCALDAVLNGIMGRKGLILVSGAAGTGKTTLLKTMAAALPAELAEIAMLRFPAADADEFFEMLLTAFGLPRVRGTKAQKLLVLEKFLLRARAKGKTAAVLIDEAHLLAMNVLEEVCLLNNLEMPDGKLLQTVLAGQPEIEDRFAHARLQSFGQRIACRARLEPLLPAQTAIYIDHRWRQAGGVGPPPFGPDALDYLGTFSLGVPRVVNELCDNALELAWSENAGEVLPEHVVTAAKVLSVCGGTGPRENQRLLFRVYEGGSGNPA